MSSLPFFLVFISTFMHAGWNLLARRERGSDIFLPLLVVVCAVGLLPTLLAEWLRQPILPAVWLHLLCTGVFQALYYLGLLHGYRSGHFSVVYPLARSLPVLLLAVVDVLQGQPPSAWGWLGMILISLGCLLAPLESWRGFSWRAYWDKTMIWILVTAGGMIGYTLVDRAAAHLMQPGLETAVRYGLFESATTLVVYWLLLKLQGYPIWQTQRPGIWKTVLVAAVFMFGAYSLVLWAYQLAEQISYVVALRQFSIVLGVVAGAVLFREPAPRWRISMSLIIVCGVVLISVAG